MASLYVTGRGGLDLQPTGFRIDPKKAHSLKGRRPELSQRDKDMAFFVVWILNKAAQAWGRNASDIYRELQKANIVDDYLLGFYDTVHSMSESAVLEDLRDVASRKGLAL